MMFKSYTSYTVITNTMWVVVLIAVFIFFKSVKTLTSTAPK